MINLLCYEPHYGYLGDYVEALNHTLNHLRPSPPHQIIKYNLLGLTSEMTPRMTANPDDWHLCFQIMPPNWTHLTRTIIINTEQLTRPQWSQTIKDYLNQGLKVWDYDQFQSQYFKHPQHQYLPYPISQPEHPLLRHLSKHTPKQYDVVTCASPSPRRSHVLEQLRQLGLSVLNVQGLQLSRDQQIAQGRLLLNIHFDQDYQVFEHLRCDRWLLAGMIVITEPSQSDPMSDLSDLVINVPYERIVSKIQKIIQNYDHYQKKHKKKLRKYRNKIIDKRQQITQKCLRQLC